MYGITLAGDSCSDIHHLPGRVRGGNPHVFRPKRVEWFNRIRFPAPLKAVSLESVWYLRTFVYICTVKLFYER